MKKIKFAAISCLALIAIVGLFCEPSENLALPTWVAAMVGSKAVGISAAWWACKLLNPDKE